MLSGEASTEMDSSPHMSIRLRRSYAPSIAARYHRKRPAGCHVAARCGRAFACSRCATGNETSTCGCVPVPVPEPVPAPAPEPAAATEEEEEKSLKRTKDKT